MTGMVKRIALLSTAGVAAFALGGSEAVSQLRRAEPLPPPRPARWSTRDSIAYLKRPGPGWSVAQVQRMKKKRRNRLRAKGRFRQAVR